MEITLQSGDLSTRKSRVSDFVQLKERINWTIRLNDMDIVRQFHASLCASHFHPALISKGTIRVLESLTAHLFPVTKTRDYIEFHVALTLVVRGFESATKPRVCDSINNNGGDRSRQEKVYELGASPGRARSPLPFKRITLPASGSV